MIITSPQNPRVKYALGLRERRTREQTGLVLVEGYEELALTLHSGAHVVELFICPPLFRMADQAALAHQIERAGAQVIEVDERVFQKIAYRENPDGWLATIPTPQRTLDQLQLSANPLLVITESVEKPGNLGAILRTADAAGVDALIACDPHTDWGNPNVVRASKGALFCVQVATASSADTLDWLRTRGIKILIASPEGQAMYTKVDMRVPVALAFGTEKHGLSEQWFAQADIAVQIPMFGRVNSLNVATSAALIMYEAVRQRR